MTVLTPTMPERELLLAEAMASVAAQSVPVVAHLIRCSKPAALSPLHMAYQRNLLLRAVTTEWVATLDDDDLWLANHVETAEPFFASADVVYTWPEPDYAIHRVDCTGWPRLALATRLRQSNFIPSAAFIRTEALRAVGGWSTGPYADGVYTDTGTTWEDWDLWSRLAAAGADFVCVPEVTWQYRIDGDWRHAITATPEERERGLEEVLAW